ncbi:hypothetical protein ACFL2I_03110 [Candidatus Omnitrophota bacterium]
MTAKEILGKCSNLPVDEKREVSDDYAELVFFNKELNQWNETIAGILGPAAKPSGEKPSDEDAQITEEFGGIFDNQTLFKKELPQSTIIAMFWPWQDEIHTTLKVAVLKK